MTWSGRPALRRPQPSNEPGRRGIEAIEVAAGARRGSRSAHSALPSSTPHWSKLLMPHSAPLVKTRCSYSAISAPRLRGVSCSSSSVVLGRLPGKVRCCASVSASSVADAVGAFSVAASSVACRASAPAPARGRWPAAWCAGRCSACVGVLRPTNELDRDHVGALVQHLEVGVLAVGARLAPHHRAGARRAAARRSRRRACRCSPSRAAAGRPAGAAGAGGTARRCGS